MTEPPDEGSPSGPDDPSGGRTQWHVILAAMLLDLLGPTGVEVRSEVPVTAGIPRADIILIRRRGRIWTAEQRCLLADGLHDLTAREILIEFKFRESLRADDLSRISVYDYLYLQRDGLRQRSELQSVIVSARTPRPAFFERYGFQRLAWPGVWEAIPPWGGTVRLLALNRLSPAPHNAPLKLFASRSGERLKAFDAAEASGLVRRSVILEEVILGLWRVLMRESADGPNWRPLTPEDVRSMGRDMVTFVGKVMRPEELLKLPAPARILRQEVEAARKAERKAAQEAARRAALDGRVSILKRQLNRKFADLPDWVAKRLSAAAVEDLELWSERLLTAETVEEIFG